MKKSLLGQVLLGVGLAALVAVIILFNPWSERSLTAATNADAGRTAGYSHTLPSQKYRMPGLDNDIRVTEYQRGNCTYLIISNNSGISVVNYTLDSLELVYTIGDEEETRAQKDHWLEPPPISYTKK